MHSTPERRKLLRKLLAITLPPPVLFILFVALTTDFHGDLLQQSFILKVAAACIMILLWIIAFRMSRNITQRVSLIRQTAVDLMAGRFISKENVNHNDEITESFLSLCEVGVELKNKTEFASQMSQGKLQSGYKPRSDDDLLGHSLLSLNQQLTTAIDEESKRTWANDGLAKFVDILHSHKNQKDLCHDIVKNMVVLLKANQGAIFISNGTDDQQALHMEACYAFNRTKFLSQIIKPGEGIIGQTFLEGETVILKDVPQNFVRITSGLGEANPRNVLLVPLKTNSSITGIVELASFRQFENHEIVFVEKIGETIAHTLLSFQVAEQTQKLLEDSQQQAEHLKAQEEELRQNQEELQATQEEISRKYNELFKQLAQLNYQSKFEQLKSINSTKKRNIEYYFDIIRNQIITFAENKMVVEAARLFTNSFQELRTLKADRTMQESVRQYYTREFIPRLQENVDQSESIEYFVPSEETALRLQYHYISGNPHPTGQKSLLNDADDGSEYSRVHATYHPVMRSFLEKFGYYDIFIIHPETGHIVYSVFKEVDYATSLLDGLYSTTNFGVVVKQAIKSNDPNFVKLVDFEPYAPSYQAPASFIACSIYDGTTKVGVLVFQMPINKINQILTGNNKWMEDGLGISGETRIVGQDFKLRSIARDLIENKQHYLSVLKQNGYPEMAVRQVDKMDTSILVEKIQMQSVSEALNGKTGIKMERNNLGIETLNTFSPLAIADVHWAIVSSMNEEEASRQINELKNRGGV